MGSWFFPCTTLSIIGMSADGRRQSYPPGARYPLSRSSCLTACPIAAFPRRPVQDEYPCIVLLVPSTWLFPARSEMQRCWVCVRIELPVAATLRGDPTHSAVLMYCTMSVACVGLYVTRVLLGIGSTIGEVACMLAVAFSLAVSAAQAAFTNFAILWNTQEVTISQITAGLIDGVVAGLAPGWCSGDS